MGKAYFHTIGKYCMTLPVLETINNSKTRMVNREWRSSKGTIRGRSLREARAVFQKQITDQSFRSRPVRVKERVLEDPQSTTRYLNSG